MVPKRLRAFLNLVGIAGSSHQRVASSQVLENFDEIRSQSDGVLESAVAL
jgi:hypothetical protein